MRASLDSLAGFIGSVVAVSITDWYSCARQAAVPQHGVDGGGGAGLRGGCWARLLHFLRVVLVDLKLMNSLTETFLVCVFVPPLVVVVLLHLEILILISAPTARLS